jgi:hypothetical protein
MGGETAFARQTLFARAPRPAELRLVKEGVVVASVNGPSLTWEAASPGVYRVEARLPYRGRARTWIVANPIYLR